MGNKRPRDDKKAGSISARVRALKATLDAVLGDDEPGENHECSAAEPVVNLSTEAKAFVAQFSQVEAVERMLADKAERKARRDRLRRGPHR